jgi:hypothetical protein
MADITDPNAIRFANEQIRTLCDRVPTIYALLKQHALLFSDTPGLTASFPNDPTAIVQDGSPGDGRRPYSGADVQALEAAVAGFVAQLEANDRALLKLALKIAVNPAVSFGA